MSSFFFNILVFFLFEKSNFGFFFISNAKNQEIKQSNSLLIFNYYQVIYLDKKKKDKNNCFLIFSFCV